MEGAFERDHTNPEILHKHVSNIVDEILRANLLVPQTYGAIRSLGALSVLQETNQADGVNLHDLTPGLYDTLTELADQAVAKMKAAHRASDVKIKDPFLQSDEAIHERVEHLIKSHFEIAVSAAEDALETVYDLIPQEYEGSEKDFAIALLQLIHDALRATDIREDIKKYRRAVAADRKNKNKHAAVLKQAWFLQFEKQLEESDFVKSDAQYRNKLYLFFRLMSDSSPRTLDAEIGL